MSIPAWVWQRDELRAVLRCRDIGGLFRLAQRYGGVSQSRLAVATGLLQGRISEIIKGTRMVTALEVFERIANGLGMPDEGPQKSANHLSPLPPGFCSQWRGFVN